MEDKIKAPPQPILGHAVDKILQVGMQETLRLFS